MENWTKEHIPDLNGKVVIITGSNIGLGYESALGLAEHNAQVIIACLSQEQGRHAVESIRAHLPAAQ